MRIKVIGTIVENPGDGQRVHVRWDSSFAPKEWYFFTNRRTLWSVSRGANPYSDFLIAFTFYGATQNYEWFVSQSYWQRQISGPPKSGVASPVAEKPNDEDAEFDDEASTPPYGVSDMTAEGAFVSEAQLTRFLSRLHDVKNLILQGPPGVGKTWFAKRLAFALMGERDEERVTRVQFHQTTSYEDFVRGLRPKPDGSGAFALVDGPFVEAAEAARADPSNRPHVVIIEEVNRGNPSQIFGELLTLLEWDKRSPEHGLKLVHSRESEPPFYVPENLFLIGTMNLADRSLAIVDFALRRRFAFETIPACFDDRFRAYVGKIGLPIEVATEIAQRMAALNEMISADPNLGSSYAVGHSFFCPTPRQAASPDAWYTGVIETQILPLLEEYWFDQRANITKAQKLLLDGFPS